MAASRSSRHLHAGLPTSGGTDGELLEQRQRHDHGAETINSLKLSGAQT